MERWDNAARDVACFGMSLDAPPNRASEKRVRCPPATCNSTVRTARFRTMTAISISELHEHTDLWVRKATEQEPIVLTDNGRAVAKIVPVPAAPVANPFLTRKLLPGYAAIMHKRYGGQDSTAIISEMRDGR